MGILAGLGQRHRPRQACRSGRPEWPVWPRPETVIPKWSARNGRPKWYGMHEAAHDCRRLRVGRGLAIPLIPGVTTLVTRLLMNNRGNRDATPIRPRREQTASGRPRPGRALPRGRAEPIGRGQSPARVVAYDQAEP